MHFSDIQTWFNMQGAKKTKAPLYKTRRMFQKKHANGVCRIFTAALLRSRFTLWIFLVSKVRKANNELLIHEQKRKVGKGKLKFFLDVSHPWNVFKAFILFYFWLLFCHVSIFVPLSFLQHHECSGSSVLFIIS